MKSLNGLWRDESGVILPYVTVMLLVFVGTASLAIDAARLMSLQTQIQKAADAAAIAGAAELDRFPTSTDKAFAAATTMLSNYTLGSAGGNVPVAIQSVRFLSALPANDTIVATSPICSGLTCTPGQSVAARFVEVVVAPVTFQAILPLPYINSQLTNNLTTSASAVAGSDSVNCGLTPMFICNPFELSGDTYDIATQRLLDADSNPLFRRQLIRLADHGPSGTWGPGDFGYLRPEPGTLGTDSCFPSAGDEIGKAMAAEKPLICVKQNGVDLLTGNTTSAKDGLNTRFGLYRTGGSWGAGSACRTTYPPDRNVRKAMQAGPGGDWCRATPNASDSGGSPQWPPGNPRSSYDVDNCLVGSNSCSPNPNVGATSWRCQDYWVATYGAGVAIPDGRCTNTATMSRYELYELEVASATYLNFAGPNGETGTPNACAGAGVADRRILQVAIVNCRSSPVTIQSNATDVPVAAFGRFFLTHPTTNATKPYAEFMGLLKRGQGTIYDNVQLYR